MLESAHDGTLAFVFELHDENMVYVRYNETAMCIRDCSGDWIKDAHSIPCGHDFCGYVDSRNNALWTI